MKFNMVTSSTIKSWVKIFKIAEARWSKKLKARQKNLALEKWFQIMIKENLKNSIENINRTLRPLREVQTTSRTMTSLILTLTASLVAMWTLLCNLNRHQIKNLIKNLINIKNPKVLKGVKKWKSSQRIFDLIILRIEK